MNYENFNTFNVTAGNAIDWSPSTNHRSTSRGYLKEAYWLYQATSQTPALKRFQWADDNGAQFDVNNQRGCEEMLTGIQDIR